MGRGCTKANENLCFRCRKEAALHDDRLSSRERAAEMLGISVSSLADYELGVTKVIPVDKIVLMADLYKAPELKVWYCSNECPIGRGYPMPDTEPTTVESVALRLIRMLRQSEVESVREALIDIMADGVITADETTDLIEILEFVDELIAAAGELKLIGSKIMNEGA